MLSLYSKDMAEPTLQQILDKIDFLAETMATKDDLKQFITKEDAKQFLTKEDAKQFATKADLDRFATKSDLEQFATKSDLERFATRDDLKQFATKADLKRFEVKLTRQFDIHKRANIYHHLALRQELAGLNKKFDKLLEGLGKASQLSS